MLPSARSVKCEGQHETRYCKRKNDQLTRRGFFGGLHPRNATNCLKRKSSNNKPSEVTKQLGQPLQKGRKQQTVSSSNHGRSH